jgi:hypothetical protein
LNNLAPWLTQGAGGVAFALVWLIRSQFETIKAEQKKTSSMLRRLIKIHCEHYPDEAYELLHASNGNAED